MSRADGPTPSPADPRAGGPARQGTRRRLRVPVLLAVAALLAAVGAVVTSLTTGATVARSAATGQEALRRAEQFVAASKFSEARRELDAARGEFSNARRALDGANPMLWLGRAMPLVRVQLRAASGLVDAGVLLAEAGIGLTDTVQGVVEPRQQVPVAVALAPLEALQASLGEATSLLDGAVSKVAALDGYRLFGPLATARNDLATRLPRIEAKAVGARNVLAALVSFSGGTGPRRYLFLSQNPAEQRPTGGFIGTYGVVAAQDGTLRLERYDSIESWTRPRPEAAIPADQAGSPFPFLAPPRPQTLGNINSIPDWPSVAQAATELWRRGGEDPVDGVVSTSTGFLARLLGVLGPTAVEDYGETVTAVNVIQRIDFYVRQPGTDRKDFVAAVAESVLAKLLNVPADRWPALARVVQEGLDARELLVWSKDEPVRTALAQRGWEGRVPAVAGDFFLDAHFAFATKNGRGIKRTYEHLVSIRPDRSAVVTTTITIENTEPPAPLNLDTLSYITLYGPQGATLLESSDPGAILEPPLAGHPAAAWFRAAPPLGTATLKVAWEVPDFLVTTGKGQWQYRLAWWRVPDHAGDVLRLRVDLPEGWEWVGEAPPAVFDLTEDLDRAWALRSR